MGAGLSCSCCSADPAESKEVITSRNSVHQDASGARLNARKPSLHHPTPKPLMSDSLSGDMERNISDATVAHFQKKLEESVTVVVILADGKRLTCALRLTRDPNPSLVISCDTNVREIPLHDLTTLLYGKYQLRRVETKATIANDPNCVALHMSTGNCIPIQFVTTEDKLCFIELIQKLKSNC